MGSILQVLRTFFVQQQWTYTHVEGGNQILVHVAGTNGSLTCIADIQETPGRLVFYILFPMRIPEGMRHTMAEYVARANSRIAIGNFELDFDEGVLGYRTGIEVDETLLTTGLIRPLLKRALLTADQHVPWVMAILDGHIQPADALEQSERYPLDEVMRLANDLMED